MTFEAKFRLVGILAVFIFSIFNMRVILETTSQAITAEVAGVLIRVALNLRADMRANPKNMTQLPHSAVATNLSANMHENAKYMTHLHHSAAVAMNLSADVHVNPKNMAQLPHSAEATNLSADMHVQAKNTTQLPHSATVAMNLSAADIRVHSKNTTQLPHSTLTPALMTNITAASFHPMGDAVVNRSSTRNITAKNLAISNKKTCIRAAAYGSENPRPCWGNELVKSVTVRAPNCGETCAGIRYHNPNPDAKYTIELVTDGAFHIVQNSPANCKLALLWEPPAISPGMYTDFLTNKAASAPFHKVFTNDPKLIDSDPGKFMRYLAGDSWVRTNSLLSSDTVQGRAIADYFLQQALRGKRDGVSMIFSKKQSAPVCAFCRICICVCLCVCVPRFV
jgi:hypothetical protein